MSVIIIIISSISIINKDDPVIATCDYGGCSWVNVS